MPHTHAPNPRQATQGQAEPDAYALARIQDAALPLTQPLYAHYPAMKLGGLAQVDYYAERLLPEVARIIATAEAGCVLTAPPVYRLPAAANLLARRIHALLGTKGEDIALEEMRLRPEGSRPADEQAFNNYLNYSKNDPTQRKAERDAVLARIDADALGPAIAGKHAIVINDINVTGTQQRSLHPFLLNLGARACDWIYIFAVAPELARTHPGIEFDLNTSRLADTEAYIAFLNDADAHFTARCVSRLFASDAAEFTRIVQALQPARRALLHDLAVREERYDIDCFRDKWRVLRQAMNEHEPMADDPAMHIRKTA